MNGGSMLVRPPPLYVDRRRQPEQRDLAFSAPPDLLAQYGSARQVVYELRRLRRDKERALAAARKRSVLGALAAAQQHPWTELRAQACTVADEEVDDDLATRLDRARGDTRGARIGIGRGPINGSGRPGSTGGSGRGHPDPRAL